MANQKDILERVSELPDDLRKALFAPATTDAIKEVGKKQGLMIDKIGELAQETGRVMLGITPPAEYIKNLTKRLDVEPEKAKAIAEEINQKIFQPVRESLKRVHGLSAEAPKGAKAELAAEPAEAASKVTPPPTPSLLRRGAEEVKSPPLQGGAGEVKKPLPKREDIMKPSPQPPPLRVRGGGEGGGVSLPPYEGGREEGLGVKEEVKKAPPSIFVKKPASLTLPPEVIPPIFEKHVPNENKSRDPYREPIEP